MSGASLVSYYLTLWLLVGIVTDVAIGYVDGQGGIQYYNCLKNVHAKKITATSVTLKWDFQCDNGDQYDKVLYKITTTHMSWLACESNNGGRDNKRRHNETDNNQITIGNLYPFSDYNFEIKAIPVRKSGKHHGTRKRLRPDETDVEISTLDGIPGISPRKSTFGKPSTNDDKITFFWRAPEDTSCRDFNGVIDGYKYQLKGLDKWSRDDEFSGDTRPDMTRFIFEGLQPMSTYVLKVYVKNSRGQINEDFPLELTASTRESDRVEYPPQNLKAVLSEESLLLSWQPPYPPTSTIAKYIVQWKVAPEGNGKNKWNHQFEVIPKIDSCQKLNIQTVNPELMCHKIENFTGLMYQENIQSYDENQVNFGEDVETEQHSQISFGNHKISKNFVFHISAVAPNQRASDIIWSKRVLVTTNGTTELPPEQETGWIAIAVIVCLVVIFLLVLIGICIRHRCNQTVLGSSEAQRKGSYKHVPPYESQYNGVNPPSLQTQPSILSETSYVHNPSSVNTSIGWSRHQPPSVEFRRSLPPPQRPPYRNSKNNFSAENSNTLPRNSESANSSTKQKSKDYSHILLPTSSPQTHFPPSIIGTPLPPVPTEEPIYDELQLDTMLNANGKDPSSDTRRLSFGNKNSQSEPHEYTNPSKKSPRKKSEGFESDDDFLESVDTLSKEKDENNDSDDNDYLAPTTREKRPNTINNLFRKSCSDIDNETNECGDEYLMPTFNVFDRINSRDLSPPHEKPPPIPMQSYMPLPGTERVIPIKIEK